MNSYSEDMVSLRKIVFLERSLDYRTTHRLVYWYMMSIYNGKLVGHHSFFNFWKLE